MIVQKVGSNLKELSVESVHEAGVEDRFWNFNKYVKVSC